MPVEKSALLRKEGAGENEMAKIAVLLFTSFDIFLTEALIYR